VAEAERIMVGNMVVGADELGDLAAVEGPVGDLQGDATVSLNFVEPIDLVNFATWVGQRIGKNVFIDESFAGQTVLFKAPMEVRADQLLALLSALVEERGYALTADPMGWYSILPAQQGVQVNLTEDGLATTRVIPTPLVRPSQLVNTIQTSFQQQPIRIAPVDDIGALIVTAPARTMLQVEAMVERIVKEMRQMKLRRLQLNYVSADYALTRILEINGRLSGGFGGLGGGVVANPNANVGASSGALTSLDSRLFVDQGNALLFKGTEDEYESLEELIEMIDQISPLISRRYSAGTVVEDVARAAEREGLGPVSYSVAASTTGGFGSNAFGGGRNIGNQFGGFGNQQVATYGSGFTVDVQTGSFVYHGTEPQHARVAALVKEFSEQAIRDKIEIRAYKLHHADPEAVADILSQLIDRQQEAQGAFFTQTAARRNDLLTPEIPDEGGTGDGGGQGFTVSAEETTVVADLGNAQVMVRARARDHEQIAKVIESLDQRRPQVAVRAKIISVTVRDSFDWTADVQINAGQFSFLSSFGLTTGPAGDLPGPRTVANNLRGATTALIRSDFLPIAINALKTVGDTRVVSSPQIVVNDNEQGTVVSQRNEPYSSSSQSDGGIITSQGGTAEAGTRLEVTPQISEGGYLKLTYTFELSEFDQAAAQGNGLAPPSQEESYESVVTIPSGSTVVVGGFVLERDSESDNMVPILGEIPGLGALFKDYSKSKTRTMIFVFITPEILNDQNFIDLRLVGDNAMELVGEPGAFREFAPIRMPVKGTVGPAEKSGAVWE
ncbi:MAG: hypothetical protein KDA30_14510, partial [Phycisphaerales bacterium]|nr:hypothetical protein [Phycisphaerales bacterium]